MIFLNEICVEVLVNMSVDQSIFLKLKITWNHENRTTSFYLLG